jgi:hypothetical protein
MKDRFFALLGMTEKGIVMTEKDDWTDKMMRPADVARRQTTTSSVK